MNDSKIIKLFFKRSQDALHQVDVKYGRYAKSISSRIIGNSQDAEECVSDGYMVLWDTIPPKEPDSLKYYLASIVRNKSIDKVRHTNLRTRGGLNYDLVYEELEECIGSGINPDCVVDRMAITDVLNDFLGKLNKDSRRIFILRYWHMMSIKDICDSESFSASKVKISLSRTRASLAEELKKAGVINV